MKSHESASGPASSETRGQGTESSGYLPDHLDQTILHNRTFGEAPMLTALVSKGELPPVSERLPENPLVIRTLEQIGRYGGTIRRAITTESGGWEGVSKTLNENLMGYSRPSPDRIEHALAESHEFFDEGKTVIFKIRKGVKWSDGAPFTVDDIIFWYYDVGTNEETTAGSRLRHDWMLDGELIKFEKIDTYTLKVSAQKPMGRILNLFSADELALPKHVMAKDHPNYNPDATYDSFNNKASLIKLIMEPGVPRLSAWFPSSWVHGQKVEYERNPYYWKVDTAGNQLPYADVLSFRMIPDSTVTVLKFVNGEFDLAGRNVKMNSLPILQVEEPKGGFKLLWCPYESMMGIYLNWDAPNPVLREAIRKKKVRVALSQAINREEIGEIACYGLLMPGNYSYAPSSPYFSEEDFKRYSGYNPELANRLLDEAGYRDTDGDGIRELADGSRFEITIDIATNYGFPEIIELIAGYWKEVGVLVHRNLGMLEIIYPRRLNGEFEGYFASLSGTIEPLEASSRWGSTAPNTPFWHRTADTNGPDWLQETTALMEQALIEIDPDKVRELLARVQRLHSENAAVIGFGAMRRPWGASYRLGNVPNITTFTTAYRGWSRPLFHEQIFIRE